MTEGSYYGTLKKKINTNRTIISYSHLFMMLWESDACIKVNSTLTNYEL